MDEPPRAEAPEEVDRPGDDGRGSARRDERHRRVEPTRVRPTSSRPHEPAHDEGQRRGEDEHGREAEHVEAEEDDERETPEHDEEASEGPIVVAIARGDERQGETAREHRQQARVLLERERDPGEDAGKHERRPAPASEVAIERRLRGEPGRTCVPRGVRDVEGREVADEEGKERHVPKGRHGGEEAACQRTGEGEQQDDRRPVHRHQGGAQWAHGFAEEAEEPGVQIERTRRVAGMEIDERRLSARRPSDLVEEKPFVLEVDAVREEAREVRCGHQPDAEESEASHETGVRAQRRPSR